MKINFFSFLILVILVLGLALNQVNGQISIDSNTFSYNQDFNSLVLSGTGSTLPTSWQFNETGSSANTTYSAGTGSSNAGDTYSFGSASSTDRSLGGIQSGNLIPIFGVSFINNTSEILTQLPVKYTGEQWRLGAPGRVDKLLFQYSLNATSLTTGSWISIPSLDFIAPVTTGIARALDGNAPGNHTTISYTISGISLDSGSIVWMRWVDTNATSSDDGLGIDDFIFNESNDPLPVELSYFNSSVQGTTVTLNWETVWEMNNYGFEIEKKSLDGDWNKIGFVSGSGNTTMPVSYTFIEDNVNTGIYKYRLKQIDFNGNYEYHNLAGDVIIEKPQKISLNQNYPNPCNPSTILSYTLPTDIFVSLIIYDILGREVAVLVNEIKKSGYHNQIFNSDNLASGIYFYTLSAGQNNPIVKKMTIIK